MICVCVCIYIYPYNSSVDAHLVASTSLLLKIMLLGTLIACIFSYYYFHFLQIYTDCWIIRRFYFQFCDEPLFLFPRASLVAQDLKNLPKIKGTRVRLLQHHSSKASILHCSALFIVRLSHPCMTTGKTIALTRWTFADKVTSLLSNMLSRLVITFLPGVNIF